MNVISVIVFLLVSGLTIWLLIDTIIYFVKRHKAKKENKNNDEVKTDEN